MMAILSQVRWINSPSINLVSVYPYACLPFQPAHCPSDFDAIYRLPPIGTEGIPDSKVHGANMGPTWVLSMNLAIRDYVLGLSIPLSICPYCIRPVIFQMTDQQANWPTNRLSVHPSKMEEISSNFTCWCFLTTFVATKFIFLILV